MFKIINKNEHFFISFTTPNGVDYSNEVWLFFMSSDTSSVMLVGFILAPFICKIQTSGKTLGVREIYTIKYKIYQSHVNF